MKLDENVNIFFDTVTEELHSYIHHPNFKKSILKDVSTSWRHKIDSDVTVQIETKIKKWEETHVEQIYMDMFVKNINDKLKMIDGNQMIEFKMPHNQGTNNAFKCIVSAVPILGILARVLPVPVLPVATGVVLLAAGLTPFMYINDFKTVCENAINVKINKLSTSQIKQDLRDRYATFIRTTAKEAFENMKVDIDKLTEEIKEREKEETINTSIMQFFMNIYKIVCKCKQQLQNIENMCDAHNA